MWDKRELWGPGWPGVGVGKYALFQRAGPVLVQPICCPAGILFLTSFGKSGNLFTLDRKSVV